MAAKPECISAVTERAVARSARSAGHSPACGRSSAAHSAMASVSQTTSPLACRHGTRPVGEMARTSAILPLP
jgi:hypothetical protein